MSVISGASTGRWSRRAGLARAYRSYVLAGPLLTLAGVAFFGNVGLPTSNSVAVTALRWTVIASLALVSAVLADRTLSRLLPIAALLDLELGFPGAVPTRSHIASLVSLRGRDAERTDQSPGTADRDLDAAVEHLLVRYAMAASGGLRQRSHVDRVRALAAELAQRLDLTTADVDRLRWALLMRDVGSFSDDERHPHQPLAAWLGPFAALVHGPYARTAASSASRAVRTAAHAAAVADAYVVVTAAHPYRHDGQPLPLDALTGTHLLPQAVYALHSLSEQERRRALGLTAGVSPLLARYTPRPQPALTLASVLAVLVLAVGAGIGPPPDASSPAQALAVSGALPALESAGHGDATPKTPAVSPSPRYVETTTGSAKKAKRDAPQRGTADLRRSGTRTRSSTGTFDARTSAATGQGRQAPVATTAASSQAPAGPSPSPSSSPSPSPSPKPSPTPSPKPSPSPAPTPTPTPTPPPPPPEPTPPPDTDPPADTVTPAPEPSP